MTFRHLALITTLSLGAALPAVAATINSPAFPTGSSGFEADQNGLRVLVNGSLSGPKHAIKLNDGNDNTVINNGVISGGSKDGINADGANLTVVNFGRISGGDEGVQAKDSDGLLVQNYGTISGGDEGVEGADDVVINNAGRIEAVDDAVNFGERGTLVNSGVIENIGGIGDKPQDAIDLDSGDIVNEAGGVIRSTFGDAIDFDATDDNNAPSSIVNYGTISGKTGILVEKGADDKPNLAAQIVQNHGLIEGTAGLAVDLGAGNDYLGMFGGATLVGGADMGEGDDLLVIAGLSNGQLAGGSLLDGGAGFDAISFADYLLSDLTKAVLKGDSLMLALKNDNAGKLELTVSNWESYIFADSHIYTTADLVAAVAPVPLPAGGVLLLAGLGGFGLMRRKRG